MDFMRFGCFTFGGGMSIIAQMQQLYVEKRKALSSQELLDLTSVAKSLPGTMIGNVAMFYGYRVAGLAGGFVAVFGMTVPPMIILILVSFGYQAFRSNYWVSAAMEGMQAAVVPIIISAAAGMRKGSIQYPPCFIVMVLGLAIFLFTDISPIYLILFGVLSGILIGSYYERKEAKGHDTP